MQLGGDVVELDDCADEMLVDDCLDPSSNGACRNGVCGCADGFGGADCTACVFYVNGAGGDDSGSGGSWTDSFATVQAGLDAAETALASFGSCEVWVAQGTYVPTTGSGRDKTIALKDDVALYGGFAGTEFVLSQRDIAANETILSGDLDGDGDASDNAYHVVFGADGATIDGFTITSGNANGSSPEDSGGGMYNGEYSTPTVTNCIFWGNSAVDAYPEIADDASSSPVVSYSIVAGGYAGTGNLSVDPWFVSASDLRLQSGSSAIDVGDNAAVPATLTTDLDGNDRIACGNLSSDAGVDAGSTGCTVDMGAYEYQP